MSGESHNTTAMEIEPLGLTDADLVVVRAACVAASLREEPGILRYWSCERRLLWLALVAAGAVRSWLVVPCATTDEVERLSGMWAEVVANGLASSYQEAAGAIKRAAI